MEGPILDTSVFRFFEDSLALAAAASHSEVGSFIQRFW